MLNCIPPSFFRFQISVVLVGNSGHHGFLYAAPKLLASPLITAWLTSPTCVVKQFIRNVRAAKTIADERAVIQKESAAIRASFREESHDHNVR